MRFVRYGIPLAIAVAGAVLVALGGDVGTGAGIVLIGVAGLVLLANAFVRLAIESEDEREQEQRAREFFSRHGRWPRQGEDARS
jgi:hypothetical protein